MSTQDTPKGGETRAVREARELRQAHERGEHRVPDIWCSSCLSERGAAAITRRTAARKARAKR